LVLVFFIVVDIGTSIPNGINNEVNDAASLYGTIKNGAVPGASGQSTLSRKSSKEMMN
jgi:hypothetical protein